MSERKNLTSPVGIVSFPYLHRPQEGTKGQDPKFSVTLIFKPISEMSESDKKCMKAMKASAGEVVVDAQSAIVRGLEQRNNLVGRLWLGLFGPK